MAAPVQRLHGADSGDRCASGNTIGEAKGRTCAGARISEWSLRRGQRGTEESAGRDALNTRMTHPFDHAESTSLAVANLFTIPEPGEHQPREIADRLVADMEEFAHLRLGQPAILILFRCSPKVRGGRRALGETCLPRFMGALSTVGMWLLAKACNGMVPHFLILIDAEWWRMATPQERAALIHYELKHCGHARDRDGEPRFDDDGNPIWAIEAHDIAEFQDTVRRYGAWSPDVASFAEALKNGGVT